MPRYCVATFVFATTLLASHGLAETCYFQGLLGDHRPITMTVDLAKADFAGQYRYSQFGNPIWLKNETAADGEIRLSQEGGQFRGKINADQFRGNWTSADGKRSAPFDLKKVAAGEELLTREPGFTVQFVYPKLVEKSKFHATINAELADEARQGMKARADEFRELAKDEPAGHKLENQTTVDVLHADDQLVSLLFTDYEYTGGAHGNVSYQAVTYVWEKNRTTKLPSTSLVVNEDDQKRVCDMVVADLKRQKASWADDARKVPFRDWTVNPTVAGLLFTFAPYEVDSYAAGTFTVTVPYKDLKSILPRPSPLDRLLAK